MNTTTPAGVGRELTVFDWFYTDDTGRGRYAGTPEKAERLSELGVKLTPVYTARILSALKSKETNRDAI